MASTGSSSSNNKGSKKASKKGGAAKSSASISRNAAAAGGGPAPASSTTGGTNGRGAKSGGGGSGNSSIPTTTNGEGLLGYASSSNSRMAAANAAAVSNRSRSLLVIVLDVSPLAWGERDYMRSAQDRARAAKGKSSVGPVTLEEVMNAVQAFCTAFLTMERGQSALIILGVADNETAILYPRKNALYQGLEMASEASLSSTTSAFETHRLQKDLTAGVAELVARASKKAEQAMNTGDAAAGGGEQPQQPPKATTASTTNQQQAAMAAGFSKALCTINRFLVASNAPGAISALHRDGIIPAAAPSSDSAGVLALVNDSSTDKKKNKSSGAAAAAAAAAVGSWSPRILLIQASDDRSRDYNAVMNCAFCAVKHGITVDACFLAAAAGSSKSSSSSAFLEQVCDLTCGVFLAPSGAAQIGGCLTEVLLSVFLPPLPCRPLLHLPALNKVDFRARCFETGQVVNMAHVCNQCLSIFANKPGSSNDGDGSARCPTCQARILGTASSTTTNGNKRLKES